MATTNPGGSASQPEPSGSSQATPASREMPYRPSKGPKSSFHPHRPSIGKTDDASRPPHPPSIGGKEKASQASVEAEDDDGHTSLNRPASDAADAAKRPTNEELRSQLNAKTLAYDALEKRFYDLVQQREKREAHIEAMARAESEAKYLRELEADSEQVQEVDKQKAVHEDTMKAIDHTMCRLKMTLFQKELQEIPDDTGAEHFNNLIARLAAAFASGTEKCMGFAAVEKQRLIRELSNKTEFIESRFENLETVDSLDSEVRRASGGESSAVSQQQRAEAKTIPQWNDPFDPVINELKRAAYYEGVLDVSMTQERKWAVSQGHYTRDSPEISYVYDTTHRKNTVHMGFCVANEFGWSIYCRQFQKPEWDHRHELNKREWTFEEISPYGDIVDGSFWYGVKHGIEYVEKNFVRKYMKETGKVLPGLKAPDV